MEFNFYANILEGKEPVVGDTYFFQSKNEIENWLKENEIKKYKINDDLTVDVKGNVDLSFKKLGKLPVKFNKINGYFYCRKNNFTSFKGCPDIINGDFDCSDNEITSFEFMPTKVKGKYFFWGNKINSLDFLSVFNENIAFFLISHFSNNSWKPIKKILKPVEKMEGIYKDTTEIVNNYIYAIKGKKIQNIDKFIQELYENIEKDSYTHRHFAVFCQTILKDIEELQLY